MIEVILGDKTIEIPEYMTIKQYQAITKLGTNPTPDRLLSTYLDVDVDEIRDAPKDDVEFIEKTIFSMISKNMKDTMVFTFDYQGQTYGCENNWAKLSWGAWQDLEFFSSKDILENLHYIMAILYRPVISQKGTKYEIEPYSSKTLEERANLFLGLPVKFWWGVAQFFFSIVKIYIENTKNSLGWKMKIFRWTMIGIRIMPKWLRKRLRLDSILDAQWNYLMETSQKLNI